MIFLDYKNKEISADTHFLAVKDYVISKSDEIQDSLYQNIRNLFINLPEHRNIDDYQWLRDFILADCPLLDYWVENCPEKLKFDFFYKLYGNRFSRQPDFYVDRRKTYNAYALFKMMEVFVCPYCDMDTIHAFETMKGERRTVEFDHFYPENTSDNPALAMCFYNLIPSCPGCNHVMNKTEIEANPYHPEIESWSKFTPDLPIGKYIDSLNDEEIKIKLETTGKMVRNNNVLGIERRYNDLKPLLKRMYEIKKLLSPENIEEKLRLGLTIEQITSVIGKPYPQERGKTPFQKLRNDLTGY